MAPARSLALCLSLGLLVPAGALGAKKKRPDAVQPPPKSAEAQEAELEGQMHEHEHVNAAPAGEHEAHKLRSQELGDALRDRVDPRTEAVRGRVLVYVTGPRLQPAHVRDVEAALSDGLRQHPGVEPVPASSAKMGIAANDPECAQPDRCLARVAVAVGAVYVVSCQVSVKGDAELYRLELFDLQRAEVIAEERVPLSSDEPLDKLVPAAAALLQRAVPDPAVGAVVSDTGTDWQPLPNRVLFISSVIATGIVGFAALITSLQFSVRQGDYNRAAVSWSTIAGQDLVAIASQVRTLADVSNALWVTTAITSVATVGIAVLTDWNGRALVVTPTVYEGGAGVAAGGVF